MSGMDLSHVTPTANVLGTIGTVFWCVQLVPQIIKNYRRHGTDGLSALMMFSWAIAGVPFGIYTIAQYLNIPLQLQPQLFLVLALVTWAQCMYYDHGWSLRKCIFAVVGTSVVFGGIEVGAIMGIRVPINNGVDWPAKIFGGLGLAMIAAGLVPPYIDIYRTRRVRGFSFIFLLIDMAGALFSMLSLFFQDFDILAAVIYAVVLVMEGGIFLCHWYFLLKVHLEKRRAERNSVADEETAAPKIEGHLDTDSDEAAKREIPLNPIFSSISEEKIKI